ncbi:MAG: hypothetical protein WC553_02135 [Patescibacteria group bacterium]|jgi:hypothetical protein
MRWWLFFIFVGIGLPWTIYYKKLAELVGYKIAWAEKYLGGGGTYTAYFIFGIVFIILGFLIGFGIIDLGWFGM